MVRHGLGIAIFSVLSAVSISLIGCGDSGESVVGIEPFPTSTSTSTAGPTVDPTVHPTETPTSTTATSILVNDKIYNPTKQFMDDQKGIYVVQGFVPGGTGLDDGLCTFKLFKYEAGAGALGVKAEPTVLDVKLKGAGDLHLDNPFWVDGTVDDLGDTDAGNDKLYLAVTDLGSPSAVYLIDMGARSEGWTAGTAVNVFDYGTTSLATSVPLTCSFDLAGCLFWTDYSESTSGGSVKYVTYKDFLDYDSARHCGTAVFGLSYPAVIDARGPVAAVSCQGNNQVCLFRAGVAEADLEKCYGTGLSYENVRYCNYITPEASASSLLNPFDVKWITALEGDSFSSYLVIDSGLTMSQYGLASSPDNGGALWIYRYDDDGTYDLTNLRETNPYYGLLLDNLQYPNSIACTMGAVPGSTSLDIFYCCGGNSVLYNQNGLPGTINVCRYDLMTNRLVDSYTQVIERDVEDPFGLLIEGYSQASEAVNLVYTTHWNWGGEGKKGEVRAVRNYVITP